MDNNIIDFEKYDLFKLKAVAENFMKIIDKDENGTILSINSEWGTGKTTFIKMWEKMLDNDDAYKGKYETLYFNAWENDYIKDPLLAILSEMELEKNNKKQFFDNIKMKGKKLVKPILLTGLKVATHGIIDASNLSNYTKEELPELSEKIGDAIFEETVQLKNTREEFKIFLGKQQQKSNKKIIFFIDELDRCKPTFAIELLEVIKHLFSIKDIVFIISLDKEQLSYSIQNIYGQNMNVDGYLRRFFDLEFKLPSPNKKIYFYKIYDKVILNGDNSTSESLKVFKQFLLTFIKHYNFSLRDIDRLIFYITNLIPLDKKFKNEYTEIEDIIAIYIYAYLICLQIHNFILYKKIIELEYIAIEDEIIKTFKLESIMNMNIVTDQEDPIKNKTVLKVLNEELIVKFLIVYKKRKTFVDSINEQEKNIVFIEDIVQYNILGLFRVNSDESEIIKNLEFLNYIK